MAVVAEIVEGVQLKDCPFCGNAAVLKTQPRGSITVTAYYWAKCTNPECGISTRTTSDPQYSLRLWNTRSGQE